MQISSSIPMFNMSGLSPISFSAAAPADKAADASVCPVESYSGFQPSIAGSELPDLKEMIGILKKDGGFMFPSDADSLKAMASLAGKPLTDAEIRDARKHLKEIRTSTISSAPLDTNAPQIQWANMAEASVSEAASAIKLMSKQIGLEKILTEHPYGISGVQKAYFENSDVSPAEMSKVIASANDLASSDSVKIKGGSSVAPLMRGDIWKTKMSLLDKAVRHPVGNDKKPVEIDAEYYELASEEMLSKLAKAASKGAVVKVVMDPGQIQQTGTGIYDASSIAVRLSSFERLTRNQNPENMAVALYPVNEKLGRSGEIMHRKILRVGDEVVFGGMNANLGSNENVDFAMRLAGTAASEIGGMFAEDAEFSAGKGIKDVYGSRLDILSDSSKTVTMSRQGMEALFSALYSEKAGLTGKESQAVRIRKLIAAAENAGVDLDSVAEFPIKGKNGKIDFTAVERYFSGSGKSTIALKPYGRKLLNMAIRETFEKSSYKENVRNLKNSELPSANLPEGHPATVKAAVASESIDRQAILINAIDSAEKFIKISSFVLTEGIADVLIEKQKEMDAAGRPFEIEVVLDPGIYGYGGTPNEEGYKALEDAGIKVKWNLLERTTNKHDRKNHSKMMLTDKALLTGSTNFSSKGLRDNWEAGAVVYFDESDKKSVAARDKVEKYFDRMFSRESVGVDTHKAAEAKFAGYKGADRDVLIEKARNKVIREFCGKIELYERQSAAYIGIMSPELGTKDGIKGYEALDRLDDEYIDKMRANISSWKAIQSYQ